MYIYKQKIYNNYQIHLLLFFVMFSFISAQYTVSGRVLDNKGNILPGANVFIKDLGLGAIVDFDGNFSINDVPSGSHTLNVTLISYKDLSLDIIVTNKELNGIVLNLDLAPITKNKIVIEGKQQIEKTIFPICKLRFNGLYKSHSQNLANLPNNLNVDDIEAYNLIFLNNNTIPDLLLGVSKKLKNNLNTGFYMTSNEFRIFIQSSILKAEVGKINNSSVVSIGTVYKTNNRLNIEFDVNCYNIVKNIALNKTNPADNLTASLSLSINFD